MKEDLTLPYREKEDLTLVGHKARLLLHSGYMKDWIQLHLEPILSGFCSFILYTHIYSFLY